MKLRFVVAVISTLIAVCSGCTLNDSSTDAEVSTYQTRAAVDANNHNYSNEITDLSEAVRIDPQEWEYQWRAAAYVMQRDDKDAIADTDQAIKINPNGWRNYLLKGESLAREGNYQEALTNLNLGLDHGGTDWQALSWYARIRATWPAPQIRDGTAAVAAATKACELTSWKNPLTLQTLAESYAESNQFSDAVKWQQEAIKFKNWQQTANQDGQEVPIKPLSELQIQEMQERLVLFENHEPFRMNHSYFDAPATTGPLRQSPIGG